MGRRPNGLRRTRGCIGILNVVLFLGMFLTVTGERDLHHRHWDGDNTDHRHGGRLKSGFETLRIYGMYAADGIKAMGAGLPTWSGGGLLTAAALPGLISSVWASQRPC
ncbi:hypothetical protein [Enterocloster sp.]|uniref:hypothetical protein n=1 Tax=Enterocloster sp. TaxID=2719315 RepID=UPI0039A29A91